MKNLIYGVAAFVLGWALVGCAMQFQREDMSAFKVDNYECTRDARQVFGNAYANPQVGFANVNTIVNRNLHQMCMEARGYERVK